MFLETREIQLLWRDIPGFCWDIPAVPKKLEKKKFVLNVCHLNNFVSDANCVSEGAGPYCGEDEHRQQTRSGLPGSLLVSWMLHNRGSAAGASMGCWCYVWAISLQAGRVRAATSHPKKQPFQPLMQWDRARPASPHMYGCQQKICSSLYKLLEGSVQTKTLREREQESEARGCYPSGGGRGLAA